MKKFQDWFYWEGTRYVTAFYLLVVPAFAIFEQKVLTWISLALLILWYVWIKKYEEKQKRD